MKQKFIGVAISIITFFVFAELFSLGWYFISQGELFYLSDKPQFSLEGGENEELITTFRLHPFSGFVDKPGAGRNNHGFYFDGDYPFRKKDQNEYIVGVFGGSVAEQFWLQSKEELIQKLKQHPFFRNKEIIVLNFSSAGYKQPQQLLILNYYLVIGQELDMVINIDGFNEVALSNINNENSVDISMPSVHHIAPLIGLIDQTTLTSKKIESLAKINQYKTLANRVAAKMNHTNIASVYFILKQCYKVLFDRYVDEKITFEQLEASTLHESMIYFYPVEKPLAASVLFRDIALQWANSSMMMSQLLKSENIPYFHFLQPNQYYSKKIFGYKEASIALNENQPYRLGVEKGYPTLIDEFEILRQNGVNFYSAVDIFDEEAGTVYIDDCCHYNKFGNQILADFIATSILETENF
jgi:hypothetical protein